MKKLILLCFMVFVISLISGLCEEGQIDINNASLEDMMKIKHLGGQGIIAQRVIDSRPFTSLDDLIKVSGIADITLENIIEQGLACVNGFEEKESEKEKEIIEENQEIKEEPEPEELKVVSSGSITPEVIKLEPLETKDIKREDDKKVLDKSQYVKYGFVIFCILLGFLFILKNRRKQKNELV